MHLAYFSAALALLSPALASQIDFYWDNNCQQFAGTSYTVLNGATVGGPYGSQSMKWVEVYNDCNPSASGWCRTHSQVALLITVLTSF